ncbi:glycogen/starch synthase [Weeksella virosa]|uniref:starch synthase n=1 Tax=Weeksella virosa (strain ATCC 43766 / DSM 16922 / JCM 21250 / CCUG 30538 / CDC 9751 / IAM 14551 / NBRC 16016 / NCTC 11634 / CL345/78) TaxID=865938 RepID=F0P1Y0_WEEVC|nr:glycogen/starch synthase [Weeksella virosa]ADX67690.1 Starch synthase [Weeksella virosa DSM 16922]MDK7674237.1 glycogen/starch synthase [Weeksella virosa]VEH64683.1 Glycogen synthase 1 [Weeksella virosa]
MQEKRILYVTTEMVPYFPENPMSSQALALPKLMQSDGADVRIFMPRFGVINERRHQLHEVIRLSGMNMIINDIDQPLIIKVASVPNERLQVYFIDNEEYFKRKEVYTSKNGEMAADNDERAIFFAKGVLETVKKLNWKPDVVHILGWMSGLLPLYLRKYYQDDPFFHDTKVVVSLFDNGFKGELNPDIVNKLAFDKVEGEVKEYLDTPTHLAWVQAALKYADAIVKGEEKIPIDVEEFIKSKDLPLLDFQAGELAKEVYKNFYIEEVINAN